MNDGASMCTVETGMTASEAIYGFASWLTTRPGNLVVGAEHDAAVMAELVEEFRLANNLNHPRDGVYPGNIAVPAPPDMQFIVPEGRS